ncbi:FliI/YscN family ATPase [Acidisoma silvae]|uniref:Flagellum-specific ATP synthase n=1 Tax=Acidisoma silvae TaxID=2802396 RepID=A0A964DYN0_9PROT|nr:FliI/YscN family ATPase [Acidisoma silvae]MCB8874923.1 FliI/YscN family ATPase [Acidisoma silvae]
MITIAAIRRSVEDASREALSRDPVRRIGRVLRSQGDILHASGIKAPIGSRCLIDLGKGEQREAEVIGFDAGSLLLMPEQGPRGIPRGARVFVVSHAPSPLVGDALLGRVIDARGRPLDGRPPPDVRHPWPLLGQSVNPMTRLRIDTAFDTGIRAVNALATLGRGMRMGLFAGSGVGKTTLLGMLAQYASADVVVLGLIGERGREIREFVEDHLGPARARSVVVAAAADDTALGRLHGAYRAAAIAEYWRAQGKHVLLMVDSLTRLAMALREIGLSVGEPPATKGYPPSVFAAIAAFVERAGNGSTGQGSITALYTVLVEGDDHVGDPVADAARSVLDGHILLSRSLSDAALYPSIDICASLSRPMPGLVDAVHLRLAARFRTLWARRQDKQDIIDLGAYAPGRDLVLDEALRREAAMTALIRQDAGESAGLAESRALLEAVFAEGAA